MHSLKRRECTSKWSPCLSEAALSNNVESVFVILEIVFVEKVHVKLNQQMLVSFTDGPLSFTHYLLLIFII